MKKHVNIRVTGRVQNVGFRLAAQKAASERHVSGFVKNEPDGSVYLEAEGDDDDVDSFIKWCHHGPAWASVEDINISESSTEGYSTFKIR
ncbi:MAG: acylphosphatase [Bacteroidota bacterium]